MASIHSFLPSIALFCRRHFRLLVPLALSLTLLFLALHRRTAPSHSLAPSHEYHFFLFNTPCSLQVWQAPEPIANTAFRDLNQTLQELHHKINFFASDSELSQLNQLAAESPFACSEQLWQMLLAAEEAFQLTDGIFDVTVGPLMQIWGFHAQRKTALTEEELNLARQKVGFEKLTLNKEKQTVLFNVPGMQLDFGGLAKGFALDQGKAILEKHELQSFLLDLGGNLLASKEGPAPKQSFQIGIQNPTQPEYLETTLELKEACVATSGNYQRFKIVETQTIGHLMNPKTGKPVDAWAAVTVKTKIGAHSDAFSTAVFIGGRHLAEKLAVKIPGTGFLLLRKNDHGQLERITVGDIKLKPDKN